jgi:uncharacterized protein YggE
MFSRKTLYSGLLILVAMAFAAGCTAAAAPTVALGGGGPAAVQPTSITAQAGTATERGITVVGVGTANGTPDVAHITVGIETQGTSVQQAVDDNKTKMTALLSAIKALTIADKDIQTTNYSVYSQRDSVPNPAGNGDNGPLTYHVSNQVDVTVRDVSKLGDVLDKVVAAGANNIYGVNFSVDDPSKLQADARTKAFADAKARAQSLAQLAGVSLGDVVTVSEFGSGSSPIMDMKSAAMGLGGGGAPIQPGALEVSMNVQVTFAIK